MPSRALSIKYFCSAFFFSRVMVAWHGLSFHSVCAWKKVALFDQCFGWSTFGCLNFSHEKAAYNEKREASGPTMPVFHCNETLSQGFMCPTVLLAVRLREKEVEEDIFLLLFTSGMQRGIKGALALTPFCLRYLLSPCTAPLHSLHFVICYLGANWNAHV